MKLFKTSLVFVILLVFQFNLISQSLLEEGNQWHYDVKPNSGFNGLDIKANEYTINGDTIIDNIACKILKIELSSCDQTSSEMYLYEENDQLFFYYSFDSEFKLLFDFNAEVGDTLTLNAWGDITYNGTTSDVYFCKILSIENIILNGQIYEQFHVIFGTYYGDDLLFNDYYDDYIIKGIGNKRAFFNLSGNALCDGDKNDNLRCFNDIIFGSENAPNITCEQDFNVSNDNIDLEYSVDVFPNPVGENLILKFNQEVELNKVLIHSIEGRAMMEIDQIPNNEQLSLNVENLPNGVYSIQLYGNDNRLMSSKLFVRN